MNKNELLELLNEFESLPFQSETIFDIAGFPHYENVCSNILMFYFNPNNEHGLGNLFLSSLMYVANKNESDFKSEFIKIEREVSTNKGGRIDIVIETENVIIGIENKIFHHLANDLVDYSNTIDELAQSKDSIKIILSLRKELSNSVFCNVTYKDFWAEIKKRLGCYVSTTSQKWLLYLVDFMTSIEKLSGGNMALNEIDEFFIKNSKNVNELICAKNKFDSKLHNKVNELFEIIDKVEPLSQRQKIWIYRKSCLVHDFKLGNDYDVAFDLYLYPNGWILQVFGRGIVSHSYLTKLFELAPLCNFKDKVEYKDSRPTMELKPNNLNTDLTEIKQQLFGWIYLVLLTAEKNK